MKVVVTKPEPDFAVVHKELRKKGVQLTLLWFEYRELHPDGYSYSQFCFLYRQWRRHVDVVMRQDIRPVDSSSTFPACASRSTTASR